MHSITLKNTNQTVYYSCSKANIKNALGHLSATLTEYVFTTDKENSTEILCRLYKKKRFLVRSFAITRPD